MDKMKIKRSKEVKLPQGLAPVLPLKYPILPDFDIFCLRYHVLGICRSKKCLKLHRGCIFNQKMVPATCFLQQTFKLNFSLYGLNEPNIYFIVLYNDCPSGAISTRFNEHEASIISINKPKHSFWGGFGRTFFVKHFQ